ncbi:hypothetical protein IJ732_03925 [bacterium]|nr:hypothetical protein [bacterium]
MTELSTLLKEAKPLYFEKKRSKQKLQRACLSIFILFTVLASGYGGYTIRSLSSSGYIAETNSVSTTISDSLYPTDDYGLITVAY